MKKNLDMTEGKPLSLLWAFTFPTLMGNLLHQAYSITDSIVVGRYLGQTALAAVGSTTPVVLLLAALMIGVNVGVGIIISRYFGQKNEEMMRRAFVNSLYLGGIISIVMMAMGLTLSGPILHWMGTPEGPLKDATAYLEITFATTVCPLMYYLFSSAFRGMGDSQTALYCLIVSVLSNISLDLLFVAVFHWGVAGSAWATALAQALSAVFAAVLLFGGQVLAGLFLTEPSEEIREIVRQFLLITAVPGILAGVMQVYQQVLRGVDKANEALAGGGSCSC